MDEFNNGYSNGNNEQNGYGYNPSSNQQEENTTYHYSYRSSNNEGASNYYTPPQSEGDPQPIRDEKKKHKGTKKVQLDEFGNPIKPKKNKTVIAIVSIIIACVIVGIIGIAYAVSQGDTNSEANEATTSSESAQVEMQQQGDVAKTDNQGNYTVAGIAEKCIDSCVGITVYSEASSYSDFYSYGYGSSNSQSGATPQKSGEGSGVIMLEDNGKTYILTCAHVISDGSSFKVTLNDSTEYDAAMVGYDSQTDIGVLSIDATGLNVAQFGNSDSTVLGEQVVAIGCPGGLEFMNSVTSGYVSALDRPVSSSIGYDNECIQTDAAINPGNSGGALFNMQGQVIGVNSSKIAATDYEGIGFAVPSNTAIATANSLIRVGYVEGRAKIGITYTNIQNYSNSNSIIGALERLGYENAAGTMVINEVSPTSDLADKDVREYDMIVAVNDETMTDTDVMTNILSNCKPGDTIKLTIARIENNQIDTFDVDCKLIESKGNN